MLRLLRKLIPGRIMAWLRRFARTHFPTGIQEKLKSLERRMQQKGDLRAIIERQDLIYQLMDQKIEALESMLFARLEALAVRLESATPDHDESVAQTTDLAYQRLQESGQSPQRPRALNHELIERHLPMGSRVLDVGCGTGEFLEDLQAAGMIASGTDLSHVLVETCREKGLTAEAVDAVEHLRMCADDTFDAITALQFVEQLDTEALKTFLAEAHRSLRPGGVLIIETPKIDPQTISAAMVTDDSSSPRPRHDDVYRRQCGSAGFVDLLVEDVVIPVPPPPLDLEFEVTPPPDESVFNDAAGTDDGEGDTVMVADEVRLDVLSQRLEALAMKIGRNFGILNEDVFIARQVRLIARKSAAPAS